MTTVQTRMVCGQGKGHGVFAVVGIPACQKSPAASALFGQEQRPPGWETRNGSWTFSFSLSCPFSCQPPPPRRARGLPSGSGRLTAAGRMPCDTTATKHTQSQRCTRAVRQQQVAQPGDHAVPHSARTSAFGAAGARGCTFLRSYFARMNDSRLELLPFGLV